MPRKLGILGGTFDPPHLGHLIVASDAFEALGLERLILVPAGAPPHKADSVVATADQRLRMVEAAVAGDARFDVDDLELRRDGPSYTVDTLREIAVRDPDAALVFLLGTDQFRSLSTWREPAEVARLATLGVLARGGETPDLSGPYRGMAVPVRRVDISASEVRKRVAAGESVRYLVPDAVAAIVRNEGLYRESST